MAYIPYTIGFFLVALINRASVLALVFFPLILLCLLMISGGSFKAAGSSLALPVHVSLMIGLCAGFLGRIVAIAGRLETATGALAVAFISLLSVAGLLIALT